MSRKYNEWFRAVDRIILERIAVGIGDMPDCLVRDMFEAELDPEDAAEDIMLRWADDGDIPHDLIVRPS